MYSGSLTKPVGIWTYTFRFRTNGSLVCDSDCVVHRLAPSHSDPQADPDAHAKADADAKADAETHRRAEVDAEAHPQGPAGAQRNSDRQAHAASDRPTRQHGDDVSDRGGGGLPLGRAQSRSNLEREPDGDGHARGRCSRPGGSASAAVDRGPPDHSMAEASPAWRHIP